MCGLRAQGERRRERGQKHRGRACRDSTWRPQSFGSVCEERTSTCTASQGRIAVGILAIHGREDVNIFLAVSTTTGTFILMFLAALQDLPVEVDEAAMMDGVSPWQKRRLVTVPMLKPALFLVITLGVIGTWQVFDQIYVMGKGAPAGTTMTPAFLSYNTSFKSNGWGSGAAMAFIVFLIIVLLTWWQRHITLRAVDLMHSNHGTGPTP